MEIRHGIDIASVARFERAARRQGTRFLDRIFTRAERAYCESKRCKYEHFAARFAAKEAFMKAVNIRRENRCRFREIEIRRLPTGKPFLYLAPVSRKRFGLPAKYKTEISFAHEREYAIASVILVLP